jgi:zinc transport system substrate-binding protein
VLQYACSLQHLCIYFIASCTHIATYLQYEYVTLSISAERRITMKPKQIIGIVLLGIVLSGAIVLGLTRNGKQQTHDKLSVTATYYPLYDFARQVGGDKVEVTNITPAGSEPHDYEATPQQLAQAQDSKVFVYNGGHMEPWASNFLKDYKHEAIKASNNIDLASVADEENPSESIKDPHFWLDPVLAQTIIDNIRDGLSKADPSHKDYFAAQATAYKAKLATLDQDYKKGLATCATRSVISSHEAFGYLAKRYNLDVSAIAGISTEEEPSPAKLAELATLIRDKHIQYVFFETLASPTLAETLAKETGAKTTVFDPIEGLSDEDQAQGKDYISIQQDNLRQLRTALACQ